MIFLYHNQWFSLTFLTLIPELIIGVVEIAVVVLVVGVVVEVVVVVVVEVVVLVVVVVVVVVVVDGISTEKGNIEL